MLEFKTKERPPAKPIEFSIDDRVMQFTNPGWAPIFLSPRDANVLDQARLYLDWLGAGLSDEDGDWITGRLMDPNDKDFDLDLITEVFVVIIGEVSGRPTVPPSDSSPSRETADSTDGRHLRVSTPS